MSRWLTGTLDQILNDGAVELDLVHADRGGGGKGSGFKHAHTPLTHNGWMDK